MGEYATPGGMGSVQLTTLFSASALCLLLFVPGAGAGTRACGGHPATITGHGTINGTSGDDVIVGSARGDDIRARGGNDIICGAGGGDEVHAGRGTDVLYGGPGNDELHADQGGDRLVGDDGDDDLVGGSGLDNLYGGPGDDSVDGGDGSDRANYTNASSPVRVSLAGGTSSGDGDDQILSIETVVGSAYNDELIGDHGSNDLIGGNGNDLLLGGNGADLINGQKGVDTVSYDDGRRFGVELTLPERTGGHSKRRGPDGDLLTHVEDAIGSPHHDVIDGSALPNLLLGLDGRDTIRGRNGRDDVRGNNGRDELRGGRGEDHLNGGADRDRCLARSATKVSC